MKILQFVFFLLFVSNALGGNSKVLAKEMKLCSEIHQSWMNSTLEITRQTPGYSAPVAARTFSYFSIGMYESSVELLSNNQSLSGQLSDWNRNTWKSDDDQLSFPLIANEVNHILTRYFYINMPPASSEKVKSLYLNWKLKLQKKVRKKSKWKSLEYAEKLAAEIINWSKGDGADNCWNKNFPKDFQEKMCLGCWTKTLPGFERALQPFWGQNRTMLPSNTAQCNDLKPMPFSSDANSDFYQENLKIVDFYKNLTIEHKTIAKYWDDSPGVSGTPVGHLYSIALQLSSSQKLSLALELQSYVLLGIAMNDAVIESWRLKYEFSAIRPISYIQQYIDPKFNTAIPTPPFPEFPSGHSFQSGAGSEILKFIFSDTLSFSDFTNVKRTDIEGKQRSFTNFTAMSEEMSMSRFYGGIHYDYTLLQSLIFGRKIGRNTLSQIQFQKP